MTLNDSDSFSGPKICQARAAQPHWKSHDDDDSDPGLTSND
jgi:hypothetical protein